MTLVFASDLDRTLIWSAGAAGDLSEGHCVEQYQGTPLSFVHRRSVNTLRVLLLGGHLVPVTTRTEAQYRRVTLPGGPARFAVCLNGGRVLIDGVEDSGFARVLRPLLGGSAPPARAAGLLDRWTRNVSEIFGPSRLRTAEDLFHYAVFDTSVLAGEETMALAVEAGRLDWHVSVQGRKVYLVPCALTKETALRYLEDAHGIEVAAAAGDSVLDAGMLSAFGPAWTPRGSELDSTGRQPSGTAVTAATGLAASAEIVEAFDALLLAPSG